MTGNETVEAAALLSSGAARSALSKAGILFHFHKLFDVCREESAQKVADLPCRICKARWRL